MKALLLRVGIDSTDGGWQAPVCAETGEFAYVPIPEDRADKPPRRGLVRGFDEFIEPVAKLAAKLPSRLFGKAAHLDPDFDYLTYGDQGSRARRIRNLEPGDLLVFFAALRPVEPPRRPLVYAIIGLFVIDGILNALEVPRSRWRENAHTRRVPSDDDIVIRAKSGVSGRLARCIPIGEFRNRAYRVRRDLLREWGGLDVRDGWLQRSANPPAFNDAARFLHWFRRQGPRLISANNICPPTMKTKSHENCAQSCTRGDDGPKKYEIEAPSGRRGPRTVTGLAKVLSRWGAKKPGGWRGKMYVASTITHSFGSEADGFLQAGCGPNFRGGLWTLTTCKYAMRRAEPFQQLVMARDVATVVLVFCKVSGRDNRQYLVSAARITENFASMRDYFRYLRQHHSKATLMEKCSRSRPVGASLGYRFGDCHVDGRGTQRPPGGKHVHAGRAAKADLAGDHRLLASSEYLVWDRPTIWARATMRQSAYGTDVDHDTLRSLLTDRA
jgi:hypothetical protein